MQLYTQVRILKYVNKQLVLMTNKDIDNYDADSACGYDGAVVTYEQQEIDDKDIDMLHGIDSITLYTNMQFEECYNDCLQVYYMHNGNGTFNFYVKTAKLANLQVVSAHEAQVA